MTRYGMAIDLSRCIGCNTCAVACKVSNNLPKDVWWNVVHTEGRDFADTSKGTYGGEMQLSWLPVNCMHCENAPCQQVCPTHATYTTDSGVVLVDEEKCIGCKYCMAACPYGVRIQIEKTGVIEKCRFCWDGEKPGNPPACVGTCISGARVFGDLDDPESDISREIARTNAQPIAGDLTESKIYYVR